MYERRRRKEESKGTKRAASTAPKPQAGPSTASGDPEQAIKTGRRPPKRRHSKGYTPPADEPDEDDEDEEPEPPAKKPKGVKSTAKAKSNVNTRSGRTRAQTPKRPTAYVEPDGDSSPSEIGAYHKRVTPHAAPGSDETKPPRAVTRKNSSAPAKVTKKKKGKK